MMNGANNRVLADIQDSPLGLSPMGNLVMNFSGTSLSSTPCLKIVGRRLSMSNLTPGSSSDSSSVLDLNDSKCGTPRISKNVFRSYSRRGSLFRRINSAPSPSLSDNSEPGQDGNNKLSDCLMLGSSPIKTSSSMSGKSIEKHDSDSRDSGCSVEESLFRFTEPCGFPPKKTESPNKPTIDENSGSMSPAVRKGGGKFGFNFGSAGSFDDGFLEVWDLEKSFTNENEEVPVGLGNLLKGPLLGSSSNVNNDEEKGSATRPPLRRFNSLRDNYTSPASSKARMGLFRDDILSDESPLSEKLSFKRPREVDTNSAKRRKSNSLHTIPEKVVKEVPHSRYKLQRSISETAASSLALMLHKNDMIADFSRPYALPIVSGRHEDLKSITSDTLAGLLNGEYSNKVDSFKIIDCRYPYEYEGGHIKGSINLYTKEQVEQEFFIGKGLQDCESPGGGPRNEERNILIFHCEFSLERGPALYRFLRRCDRNVSSYPSLHYPEVYLLHGGYESFFSTQKSLCEPCSYQPMVDPKHENDLRKFRVKSNSWNGDLKRQPSRSGLKRLGLF